MVIYINCCFCYEKFCVVLLLNCSFLFWIFLWRLHVWGHFCLCYNDQKLVTETEYIKNYGIKDGDQVCVGFSFLFLGYVCYKDVDLLSELEFLEWFTVGKCMLRMRKVYCLCMDVYLSTYQLLYIHTHTHTHHTDKIFNPIVIHILCIPQSSVFLSIASDFQT